VPTSGGPGPYFVESCTDGTEVSWSHLQRGLIGLKGGADGIIDAGLPSHLDMTAHHQRDRPLGCKLDHSVNGTRVRGIDEAETAAVAVGHRVLGAADDEW
jgi:hypothetical protein